MAYPYKGYKNGTSMDMPVWGIIMSTSLYTD